MHLRFLSLFLGIYHSQTTCRSAGWGRLPFQSLNCMLFPSRPGCHGSCYWTRVVAVCIIRPLVEGVVLVSSVPLTIFPVEGFTIDRESLPCPKFLHSLASSLFHWFHQLFRCPIFYIARSHSRRRNVTLSCYHQFSHQVLLKAWESSGRSGKSMVQNSMSDCKATARQQQGNSKATARQQQGNSKGTAKHWWKQW